MSIFVATNLAPQIDLRLLRRDFFDGFSLLLQDADGSPVDLTNVVVCSSVWKRASAGSVQQITSFNIEKQEPLNAGRIRLWLSSAQTAAIWDVALGVGPSNLSQAFFPSAYTAENTQDSLAASPISWDIRIEKEEFLSDLVSASGGTFISQLNHGLASSERVIFRDTTEASINYDGTSSRIYTGLTNLSYLPPYSFQILALAGITNAAIGGSVYRLKQDTVAAGSVFVGTTFSNCFP